MNWLAELGLFYCAAVWGSTFYMVKDALAGVDPIVMVAYRFLLSAALLAPWAVRRGWGGKALVKDAGILAIILAVLYITQTVGLRYTTASNSGFITGLFVLFVPVLQFVFRREVPTGGQAAAVLLAVAGLWLLTGGPSRFNRGDALTLFAAVTYAAHLLYTDRCVRLGQDTVLLAVHQFWMTGVLSVLVAGAFGAPFTVADGRSMGVIGFLALFPTLSAFFIQMQAQKVVEPLRVTLIFALEPVFAALFAWTLGGEEFKAAGAAGGGLIVLAMIVSELSGNRTAEACS